MRGINTIYRLRGKMGGRGGGTVGKQRSEQTKIL